MLGARLEAVRAQRPLIHNITNYVTANDCANLLLACGASPILADDPAEAAEISAHCAGLHLNLGVLHTGTIPAMLAAGRTANALGKPVVLDPVGVGASRLRGDTARQLLAQVRFAVIRGNRAEIRTLVTGEAGDRGVDTDEAIALEQTWELAGALARETGAVVAATGAVDVVTDGRRGFLIRNGHRMLRLVTGTGCQLSALTAAFAAASPENLLEATAAAVCAMGLCGELAFAALCGPDGTAAYRGRILDAVSRLDGATLEGGAKYDLR